MEYSAKKILVLGMGDSGYSAARWLQAQGAAVTAADSRENPPRFADFLDLKIATVCGTFPEPMGFDFIVLSPGLSLLIPPVMKARELGIPVLSDVEIFSREIAAWKPQVIAITGSNGKSTVTEMAGDMCRAAGRKTVVAGNIGLPVLDTLDTRADVYVLELSSFQLETLQSLDASAATVLNLSEDHLDRYSGMEEYGAAKARIFQGGGIQILNRNDPMSLAMALPGRKMVTFGADAPAAKEDYGLIYDGGAVFLARGDTKLLAASELKVAGGHNALNALAALALCLEIGLPLDKLLLALKNFSGLPHRLQKIAEIDTIEFYDDSKGTNVGATVAALTGMREKVVVILGGDGKGQDFSPLKNAVEEKARAVVLIGRDAPLISEALAGGIVPQKFAPDLDEAVKLAFDYALPGDAVLLSPACASFDMFKNYVHRAECFAAAVRKLSSDVL